MYGRKRKKEVEEEEQEFTKIRRQVAPSGQTLPSWFSITTIPLVSTDAGTPTIVGSSTIMYQLPILYTGDGSVGLSWPYTSQFPTDPSAGVVVSIVGGTQGLVTIGGPSGFGASPVISTSTPAATDVSTLSGVTTATTDATSASPTIPPSSSDSGASSTTSSNGGTGSLQPGGNSSTLSGGAIAGIVLGTFFFVLLVIVLLLFLVYRRRRRRNLKQGTNTDWEFVRSPDDANPPPTATIPDKGPYGDVEESEGNALIGGLGGGGGLQGLANRSREMMSQLMSRGGSSTIRPQPDTPSPRSPTPPAGASEMIGTEATRAGERQGLLADGSTNKAAAAAGGIGLGFGVLAASGGSSSGSGSGGRGGYGTPRGTGTGSERVVSAGGSVTTSTTGSRNTRGTRQTSGSSNRPGTGSGSGRGGAGAGFSGGNSSDGNTPSMNSDDLFYSRPDRDRMGGGSGPPSSGNRFNWNLMEVGRAAAATMGLAAIASAREEDSSTSSPDPNAFSSRPETSRLGPARPSTDMSIYETATSQTATPAGAYRSFSTLNVSQNPSRSNISLSGAIRQGSAYSSTYGIPDVYAENVADEFSPPRQTTPDSISLTQSTVDSTTPSPPRGNLTHQTSRPVMLTPTKPSWRASTITEESETAYSNDHTRRSHTRSVTGSSSSARPISVGSNSTPKSEGLTGVIAGWGMKLFGVQSRGSPQPVPKNETDADEKEHHDLEKSSFERHPIWRDSPNYRPVTTTALGFPSQSLAEVSQIVTPGEESEPLSASPRTSLSQRSINSNPSWRSRPSEDRRDPSDSSTDHAHRGRWSKATMGQPIPSSPHPSMSTLERNGSHRTGSRGVSETGVLSRAPSTTNSSRKEASSSSGRTRQDGSSSSKSDGGVSRGNTVHKTTSPIIEEGEFLGDISGQNLHPEPIVVTG